MQIKGKLVEKFETMEKSGNFRKRDFVIEFSENPQSQFTEYLKFELIQDKCELLDKFEVGQDLEIQFDLKGRKWTNPKGEIIYFNSLRAWRLSIADEKNERPPAHTGDPTVMDDVPLMSADESDDIPF